MFSFIRVALPMVSLHSSKSLTRTETVIHSLIHISAGHTAPYSAMPPTLLLHVPDTVPEIPQMLPSCCENQLDCALGL